MFAALAFAVLVLWRRLAAARISIENLRQSHPFHSELFMRFLDSLPLAALAFDDEGRVVYSNEEARRFLRLKTDRLREDADSILEWFPQAGSRESLVEILNTAGARRELSMKLPDGRERSLAWISQHDAIPLEGWRVWGVGYDANSFQETGVGVAVDSDSRYREAIELAEAVPYYQNYLINSYEFVGEAVHEITGISPDEFTPSRWQAMVQEVVLLGPLAGMSLDEAVERARNQEGRSWRAEFRILNERGEEKWLSNAAVQVRNARGDVVGSLGILQDITERKKADEALRESEARYRSIVEDQTDFIVRWKPDFTIVYVNEAYCDYYDRSRSELMGFNFLKFIPERDRPAVMDKIKSLTPESPIAHDVHQTFRPDGSIGWQQWSDRALFDHEGNAYEFQSVGRDVTEKVKAELELQQSQERLELALRGASLCMWEYQLDEGRVSVDERWSGIVDYDLPGPATSIRNWLRCIHPEDRRRAARAWRSHVNGLFAYYEAEYRVRTRSGAYKWVLDRGKVIQSENGRAVLACGTQLDITDRKQSETELSNRNEFIETILNHLPIGLLVVDQSVNERYYWNRRFVEIHDWPEDVLSDIQTFHESVFPDQEYRKMIYETVQRRVIASDQNQFEWEGIRITTQHGDVKTITLRCIALRSQQIFIFSVQDMTDVIRANEEREALQEQLRQMQRIEAVGRLAGGIAHDFNNLLVAILGYSDLAMSAMEPDDANRRYLDQIQKAGERAEALTRQLLAFSRKQVLQPRILDLNELLLDIEPMLRRLIGEDIEYLTAPDHGLKQVKADPGQLQQVIVNLVINSRDAMPDGGKLTLETGNVDLDQSYVDRHPGASVGPHALLAVSDNGCGMDEETCEKIFEPFFTTKEQGKGTGLGMSTVYGIVKQSGGSIWVYSEPGEGTTVKVYLPATDEEDAKPKRPEGARPLEGRETILVVEDETEVRELIVQALKRYGYSVIEAESGERALQLIQSATARVRLMVTDVVMPGMNGKDLAQRMLRMQPDLIVLFMSGYTENSIVHHGVLDEGLAFIQKPFKPDVLAAKIRELLDA